MRFDLPLDVLSMRMSMQICRRASCRCSARNLLKQYLPSGSCSRLDRVSSARTFSVYAVSSEKGFVFSTIGSVSPICAFSSRALATVVSMASNAMSAGGGRWADSTNEDPDALLRPDAPDGMRTNPPAAVTTSVAPAP